MLRVAYRAQSVSCVIVVVVSVVRNPPTRISFGGDRSEEHAQHDGEQFVRHHFHHQSQQ